MLFADINVYPQEIARICHVTVRQAYNWDSGKTRIPEGYKELITLHILLGPRGLQELLVKADPKEKKPDGRKKKKAGHLIKDSEHPEGVRYINYKSAVACLGKTFTDYWTMENNAVWDE